MHDKRFMKVVRALMECAQGFERLSGAHVRELGLTPAQFDIIATLGNTEGMTCKELGEKTLITKGTLTGVLDRLEAKGLVNRHPCESDGRSWIARLSRKGQTLFDRIFPAHLDHMRPYFAGFDQTELDQMYFQLKRLHAAFEPADAGMEAA